jgi:hypothetical protein
MDVTSELRRRNGKSHGHKQVTSFDDLSAMNQEELLQLYREASVPDLGALAGSFSGRLLATSVLPGPLDRLARSFASSALFPWRGKSFRPLGKDQGEGVNLLLSLEKPVRWMHFQTRLGRSRAGDFDALHLNYDDKRNPRPLRGIQDELRQVSPGLFLGQAYLVTRGKPRLWLYFALA